MIEQLNLLEHQKIAKQIEIDFKNVGDMFLDRVKKYPEKKFLICPGVETDEFTYKDFRKSVEELIQYFKSIKLEKNDRISLIFHNSPEFLILYFAGLVYGVTVVPINPDITSREIKYILEDSKSKKIFYDERLKSKINELNEFLPKEIFCKFNMKTDLENLIIEKNIPVNEVSLNDLAVIIYTSGTTGNPKGVKLSHLNLLADSKSIANWFRFTKDTRTLCILPLFHNNGQITTLLAPLFAGGSTVIVKGKVSLLSFWEIVKQYDVTWTSVMASILSILLSIPKERKDSTLEAILCGGQVLTRTVQNDFENKFSVPIFEGYGLTETTSFSCINDYPAEKRKIGSIGKPLLTNEMEIIDCAGNILDANQEGEICIRGLNVSEGYLGLVQKNKESFRDGWFRSGDFGHKDEKGYFYIHGRQDSLIIKGGENIYPAEIENVLYKHSEVDECAVIGIPNKLLGEEICAYVKIKNTDITSEDLKEFTKNHLAGFKQPKKIIIINNLKDMHDIPKGPTKKILYKKLREHYSKIEN